MSTIKDLKLDLIKLELELVVNELELRNHIEENNYMRVFELKLQRDLLKNEIDNLKNNLLYKLQDLKKAA